MKRLVYSICRNIVWRNTQKRHCIEATAVVVAAAAAATSVVVIIKKIPTLAYGMSHTLAFTLGLELEPELVHPRARTHIHNNVSRRVLQNEKWGEMAIKGKHRQSAHPIILLYLY